MRHIQYEEFVMGRYFGTDGFRGEANKNLMPEQAYMIGRFLGWYYNKVREKNGVEGRARIILGKDTRRSSYMFENMLVGGITASGADACVMHVTTTPSVSYIAREDAFDCGIMISASHNPYYDNGIKLINGRGEKMEEEVISLAEDYLDGKCSLWGETYAQLPYACRDAIGRAVDYTEGRSRYMAHLADAGVSMKGKRIAVDCANGAAWNTAWPVFRSLGAQALVINNDPSGTNINDGVGSTHIEMLQKFVLDNKCDCGFAYDGDADRCIAVDEKGQVVDGDAILYICGRYLKEQGKLSGNTVVTTVMSNFGLYKALDALDIGYAKTSVGDKYVYEYMSQHGSSIGGEQSGHIIFSEYANTGDGILTSIMLMNVLCASGLKLSQLHEELVIYPQVLVNVRVKDKKAAQADGKVQAAVADVAAKLGDSGRILVRESGTEPLIRVMVEAESEESCRQLAQQVADVIRSQGHAAE
jgi:phosphoglucosamine mutase